MSCRLSLRFAALAGVLVLPGCLGDDADRDGGPDDIVIPDDAGFVDTSDAGQEADAEPEDGGTPDADASDGGQGDGGGALDLCDYPEDPPRVPAVSEGEQGCSVSPSDWPDCIPDACDAPDFASACRQFCEMTCERERWFCTRNHCPAPDGPGSYCETDAAMQECTELCGDDVDCLQAACAGAREVSCDAIDCPEGQERDCAGLTCTNDCATAFDGECDDGSPINASFQGCELGSDCADCGARAACFELGGECFASTQCCGFETGDAWCVNVGTSESPLGRCVADCSGEDATCAEGTCLELSQDGKACFPFCAVAP